MYLPKTFKVSEIFEKKKFRIQSQDFRVRKKDRQKTFLNQFRFPITVQICIFCIVIEFYQILNEFWNFLWCHSLYTDSPDYPLRNKGFRVRNAGQNQYNDTDPELPLVRVTLFLKTFWFSPGLLATRIEQNIVGYYWNRFALGFCLLKLGRIDNKNDKIFWKVHLFHYQD